MRRSLLWSLGLVLVAPRASADAELEPIRLVYSAPAHCPSAPAFETEVRRAAPRLRLTDGDGPTRLFTVTLASDALPAGRLAITKEGALLGARDVAGASCQEVASALAFAVALAIDPAATPPPGEPAPAPPPIRDEASSPEPRDRAPALTQAWWALSAHGLAAGGLSVHPSFGGGAAVDLGGRIFGLAPAIRLGFDYSASAPASVDGARVTFASALLSLEACPTAWSVGPASLRLCLRIDGGARIVAGEAIPGARTATRPWLDLGGMVHVRDRVAGPLFVDVGGGPLFALLLDRVFLSPDITVHNVPTLGSRGEIAVGVEFR